MSLFSLILLFLAKVTLEASSNFTDIEAEQILGNDLMETEIIQV